MNRIPSEVSPEGRTRAAKGGLRRAPRKEPIRQVLNHLCRHTAASRLRAPPDPAVGLASFISRYTVDWNYLMAGSLLATLPVIVLFLLVERHLVKGLSAGALK